MSEDGDPRPTAQATLDERSDYHPLRWLMLSGSRLHVTFLLLLLIFLALLVVGTLWELEMEILVTETRAVQTMFNTLLGGIILFVSVVLSINTAALTQEFGPLRTKQLQIEDAVEFRSDLESVVESGQVPADIDGFHRVLLRALRRELDALEAAVQPTEPESIDRELTRFFEDLRSNIAIIEKRLTSPDQRLSTSLLAGLDWDAVRHITMARHLLYEYEEALADDEHDALESLIELLKTFASGREYFTTLYFKQELRKLSASLVVLSLPVIVFTAFVLLAIDANLFPSVTILDIRPRLLYVTVAFVIALLPYVLLSAFIFRIVTVSRHSLASGGFDVTPVRDR